MSEDSSEGIVYECVNCGYKVTTKDIELRGGGVKCVFCSYRVLRKVRPPVVRRVTSE